MDLGRRAVVTELHVQFQGGFAGRECEVRAVEREGKEGREITQFHPLDNNSVQVSRNAFSKTSSKYITCYSRSNVYSLPTNWCALSSDIHSQYVKEGEGGSGRKYVPVARSCCSILKLFECML